MSKPKQTKLPHLYTPPADVQTYDMWLQAYCGIKLPHVAVCPDHYSPLEIAWLIFSESVEDVLIVANRGGGKTILLAAYAFSYALTHPESEICVLAGSEGQSTILLNYIKTMFLPRLSKILPYSIATQTKVSAERIAFPNGSVIFMRAATLKGTNAPHPHKVIFDEVECFDDWTIVQEGLNMAFTDTQRGYKAQNIFASSRKFRFGILQKLIDMSETIGLKVMGWCVFESMQQCPTCPMGEQCELTKRADGLSFAQLCRGRGKYSSGFIPIEHVLGEFKKLDPQVFDSQWLGLRPPPIGLVFPNFDRTLHVINGWVWNADFPTYAGVDFGFQDPTVALLVQMVGDRMIIFHESVFRQKPLTEVLPYWKSLNDQYKVRTWFCDPSRPDLIAMMRQAGLNAYPADRVDKHQRIEFIRARLRKDSPALLINSTCTLTIEQFESYHYEVDKRTGEPTDRLKDGNDDTIDALSYLVVGFGKGGLAYASLYEPLPQQPNEPQPIEQPEGGVKPATDEDIAKAVEERIKSLTADRQPVFPVLPFPIWRLPY